MASTELAELLSEVAAWPESESVEEERRWWDQTCEPLEPLPGVDVEQVDADGVSLLAFTPAEPDSLDILYCHGGAFVLGSGWHNRGMLSRLAAAAQAKVWAADYRLAPESPFPAALEDTETAYSWLLSRTEPRSVLLAGDSCGANLVLGAALRSQAKREPAAAGIACLSPWVDLTQSGDSFSTNADSDGFITRENLAMLADIYLDGADPADPEASPLVANLSGLPPILIQVGGGEALLSDAIALCGSAAAVGVPVRLEVTPEVIHVWQVWAGRVPEAQAAVERLAEFARRVVDRTVV